MKINWKVRLSNPHFYVQIILAILLPVLAIMQLQLEDLTTWSKLGDVLIGMIENPFILGTVFVSIYNSIVDNTTVGLGDSKQALSYTKPRREIK